MKYTTEVIINKPKNNVSELFSNPDNLKHWQPGFISLESISGAPGTSGAKSRLKYKMGKREIDMIETIISNNMPEEFSASFEANGAYNVQKNTFTAIDDNTTKLVSESEFRFKGIMKLMGWLMPGAFKKQTAKYLHYFKAFAEQQ